MAWALRVWSGDNNDDFLARYPCPLKGFLNDTNMLVCYDSMVVDFVAVAQVGIWLKATKWTTDSGPDTMCEVDCFVVRTAGGARPWLSFKGEKEREARGHLERRGIGRVFSAIPFRQLEAGHRLLLKSILGSENGSGSNVGEGESVSTGVVLQGEIGRVQRLC